jgi:photosystem I P700 chlorophyll a apoprotein A1
MNLGTADFMVHIHAFTIHVTALILFKGLLYARNSRLIPDKSNRFPFPLMDLDVELVKFLVGIMYS